MKTTNTTLRSSMLRSTRILTILVLALAIMVCSAEVSEAGPMGTAFTYQGHLYDANVVANDIYDFQFKLYDANVGGSKAANDVNVADVDVIDGYFTVELDFGSDVFDSNAVWLQIGVRPGEQNDPNAYPPLSPRQEVTPTPYALQTRGIFVDNAGNVGIGTMSPSSKLHVEASSSSPIIKSINYGTSVNSHGVYGGHASTGNLGLVGYRLAGVYGQSSTHAGLQGASTSGSGVSGHSSSNKGVYGYSGSGYGVYGKSNSGMGGYFTSPLGYGLIVESGNVGIGTDSPGAKLEVNGDLKVTGAYRGNISSSSGSDGAPFPRPAYDSGWVTIAQGQEKTLTHSIGSNVDNYVVNLEFKDPDGHGIHIRGLGGYDAFGDFQNGAYWHLLTSSSINVYRRPVDDCIDQIRIRIWVYN